MIKQINSGQIVIYDTEWTSWPGFRESAWKQPGRHCEIIQIGAVKLDAANDFAEIEAFDAFVKPRINPELSDYIVDLTGITQADIDTQGLPFADALTGFVDFLGTNLQAVFSFGHDGAVIRENCDLNALPFPEIFTKETNLRQVLIDLELISGQCYSSDVPQHLGLQNIHMSHNALGDARALAAALRHLRQTGQI